MKTNIITVLPVTTMLLLSLISCKNSLTAEVSTSEADSLAIIATINNCIGWAREKDFTLLYNTIADDPLYLEVGPGGDVTRGIDEFRKNESFWGSPDFKAIRYDIRDLTFTVSHSGDVAWFYCILDDINEWKGQPAQWVDTRWTGVVEKRNGKWVVVQQHFSFPEKR